MILIADSGSTRTTWSVITDNGISPKTCETSGINPYLQTPEEISDTLKREFTLGKGPFDALFFYGAGCANPEKIEAVRLSLDNFFKAGNINVFSDLMAAARSLCGKSPGIVAILGTGSNSCYYNGNEIARHVSPLGYILGDEGSGTVLGRKLLADVLKNQLPEEIISAFNKKYGLQPSEILENVYRKPFPNRFMAQFTHFISDHIDNPLMYKLVKSSFAEFLERNIKQFPEAAHLPVHVTGSIGWHFSDIFRAAIREAGFTAGVITKTPMDGLIRFHKTGK